MKRLVLALLFLCLLGGFRFPKTLEQAEALALQSPVASPDTVRIRARDDSRSPVTPLGNQAPQISDDVTQGRSILESIVQWGSQMVNSVVFPNDPAGAILEEPAMTDTCKTIIDFLGCDYEQYSYDGNADKVIARFTDLTEQGKAAGFCPKRIA